MTRTFGCVIGAPLGIRGNSDSRELRTSQTLGVHKVERVALRPDRALHRGRDTPPTAEFHAAAADLTHFGHGNRAVALFDQQTADTEAAEFSRESEADRARADYEDGDPRSVATSHEC